MTTREYHKHLIKIAKDELDKAHADLKSIRETSHMDFEIEEAEDNVWATQSALFFIKRNPPIN
jgi:hypothetical protein